MTIEQSWRSRDGKAGSWKLEKAAGNGLDFILSWNFRHIANAFVRERVFEINSSLGLRTPAICTPEELIGGTYELPE